MILPGMGVISEVISTFSRKRVFGYTAVAFSSVAIAFFGFFRLGAPHVHHGCVQLLRAGLLAADDVGCSTVGDQDLQLGVHPAEGLHHL